MPSPIPRTAFPGAVLPSLVLAGAIAYLVWCIAAALMADSLFDAAGRMAAEPWGWVTIVDLYVGFLVAAGVIVAREKHVMRWLPWLVALLVLGNVATAAYAIRWLLPTAGAARRTRVA